MKVFKKNDFDVKVLKSSTDANVKVTTIALCTLYRQVNKKKVSSCEYHKRNRDNSECLKEGGHSVTSLSHTICAANISQRGTNSLL